MAESQQPNRRRGAISIAELVGKVVDPVTKRRGFATTDLIAAWPQIVGPRYADCSRAREDPLAEGRGHGGRPCPARAARRRSAGDFRPARSRPNHRAGQCFSGLWRDRTSADHPGAGELGRAAGHSRGRSRSERRKKRGSRPRFPASTTTGCVRHWGGWGAGSLATRYDKRSNATLTVHGTRLTAEPAGSCGGLGTLRKHP